MGGPYGTNGVKISTGFWFASIKLRYHLEDIRRGGLILKRILGWEAWTGLIWLMKCVRRGQL